MINLLWILSYVYDAGILFPLFAPRLENNTISADPASISHILVKFWTKRLTYSLRAKLWTKYCFMKQNCQLQSGIAQYENAATPLSSKAIQATH